MTREGGGRRDLGLAAKLLLATASLVAGLILAELGASARARGAFPYLNIYRADPRYGVVLEPSASTRLRSREGHISAIRTNTLGFRGAEWSSDAKRARVLLLGDSQVFGYGVDEDETFAARLARATGAEVLNAATPTWGPIEYALAAEDLAPAHRPDVIVYAVNVANDWVEANVVNLKRSDASDGWLTRKRLDAPAKSDFPGRRWLLGRSQLVFAVRELKGLAAANPAELFLGASAAERLLEDLPSLSARRGADRSKLSVHLRRVVGLCRSLGCSVVAVVLPVDVQVDAGEWAKYGAPAKDLSATRVLADGFVADARELGAQAIDLLEPLRSASPGAFLADDPHLSARGHEVVAASLAAHVVDRIEPRRLAGRFLPPDAGERR